MTAYRTVSRTREGSYWTVSRSYQGCFAPFVWTVSRTPSRYTISHQFKWQGADKGENSERPMDDATVTDDDA